MTLARCQGKLSNQRSNKGLQLSSWEAAESLLVEVFRNRSGQEKKKKKKNQTHICDCLCVMQFPINWLYNLTHSTPLYSCCSTEAILAIEKWWLQLQGEKKKKIITLALILSFHTEICSLLVLGVSRVHALEFLSVTMTTESFNYFNWEQEINSKSSHWRKLQTKWNSL